MINLSKLALIGATVLALAASSSAQVTKKGAGYLFRAKYVKGKSTSFMMTTKIPMASTTAEEPIKYTVLDVNAKHEAKLKVAVGPRKLNGKANATGPAYTTFSLDDRNQVVKGEKEQGFENMASLALPADPIKVGQSWTSHVKAATTMGPPVDIKVTYTFKGLKTVNGVSVAVIATKLTGNIVKMGTLSGSGTTSLRVSDGSLQNLSYTINMTISLGNSGSGPIKTTLEIVRK